MAKPASNLADIIVEDLDYYVKAVIDDHELYGMYIQEKYQSFKSYTDGLINELEMAPVVQRLYENDIQSAIGLDNQMFGRAFFSKDFDDYLSGSIQNIVDATEQEVAIALGIAKPRLNDLIEEFERIVINHDLSKKTK